MANFNNNVWYQVYLNESKDESLNGTPLYARNTGAAFVRTSKESDYEQYWQFYAVDSDYYVMRTRSGGPDAYLGAKLKEEETTAGRSAPEMRRGNMTDDSALWKITPWGDGTFYLSNKQNKTDWHLGKRKDDSLLVMDSNVTGQQNGQRWSFLSRERIIDDSRYSTIKVCIEVGNPN
ncbi:hypothetical protein DM02DRAFT_536219 [Periconia macrospinosa]|uniref:Ricin B lectin domain-containing protein n=1 Tax=Periconia macrospinosa TaxID=97972 RepID=A0A2V1DFP6_9PLEO|nr:hypothetical protein DM02DRAFT_536219 [Periconia macrospinosa]